MHFAYNKGWQLVGEGIATYINPFSSQREQGDMILPSDSIVKTTRAWRIAEEERDALGIISNKGHQIEIENIILLVNDLEI